MTDKKNVETQDADSSKAKFREALEKKKQGNGMRNNNIQGGPKINGEKSGGNVPKMFRRKSGSA